MIQKGDDLINGANHFYQYPISKNVNNSQMATTSGNLSQAMSFEDYVPFESTLPPVETVLPQYIPTPPPSLPSPSVNITTVNTSVPHQQFQFQLQHQTPPPIPQHNQNNHSHYYYCNQQQEQLQNQSLSQQQQHQQVGFHSTSPFQHNHTHNDNNNKNNNNMASTMKYQLLVDRNFSNNAQKEANKTTTLHTSSTSQALTKNQSLLCQENLFNVSDASTVDADEGDNVNDEQFTYLQNLNSDNLMKFSQQSVIQQLIQEHIDVKPNLNLIPTCEEHDHGGYNFRIQVNCADKYPQRPGVIFSKETQRLYIKTNENVYIDCFYTQKMPIQPLRVRVFAVFDKDTSDPVLRCQNHISTDNDTNEIVRRSLVRCKNPDAVYYGSDTGKSINDRYSVVLPLNSAIKDNETKQMKQQLIISFTCYNSCMNRKQTAAIFLLEGANGEILAQRTLQVKICTCPKRDRRLYECPPTNLNKRKHTEESNVFATEAKMAKYENNSLKDEYSRSSFDEASDDGLTTTVSGSVHQEEDSDNFVITLKYKSRQQMIQTLATFYGITVSHELLYKTSVSGKKTRERELMWKLYETACNLKARNSPTSISTE